MGKKKTKSDNTAAQPFAVESQPRTVAVIDIGSTAIRLVIAEITADGHVRTLDRAARPIAMGRDVFINGVLSTEVIREAVMILLGFREMLTGWNIAPEAVRVIATAAIREAKNRDTFLDRVEIRTGFQIDVVEGIEENHLTYIAVQHAIGELRPQFARSGAVILEVGGGTSEIMLLHRGKIVAAHSLRIGTVRVEQQVQRGVGWRTNERIEEYLSENIRSNIEMLNTEMRLDRVRFFVAVGGDARTAAARIGTKEAEHFSVIQKSRFEQFLSEVQRRTVDEIVRDFKMTYNEAEGLLPALLMINLFLDATGADHMIVPDVSIREGVLLSIAMGERGVMHKEFASQVIASTVGLGRKYHFDEKHGTHVAALAMQLFDQLTAEHGMGRHERLLLEVSAVIHDIGNFIRAGGHHKHGQYIIENSEIFGLTRPDIRIVSNVVRYHRRAAPNSSHMNFVSMRREHRVMVMKLAAILRVADALDRGHVQRITGARVELTEDEMILHCEYSGDISIEQAGLRAKTNFFEDVFGYRVVVL